MLTHHQTSSVSPARVVIMGAGGFIGKTLSATLKQAGINVLALSRGEVDLLAAGAAQKLAALLKPEDVFVACSAIAPCKNPTMLRDNMVMAEAMIAALVQSPVAHVINISSDAVYSDSDAPLHEASPTAPDNLHGIMHRAREIMFATLPTPLAILRPTLVYGASDPHNGYGPNKFRRLANKGEVITFFGKGEERRDHVSVHDVAELAARIIAHRSTGVLNAATGTVTSFREVAQMAMALSGKTVALNDTARNGPMPHNGYRAFNPAATKAAFADFSYTSLRDGLAKAQQEEFGHGAR